MIRHGKAGGFCLACILLLLLSGCDRHAGGAEYEVIFPSGWSRDYTMWEDAVPVEGTGLILRYADHSGEKYDRDLHSWEEKNTVCIMEYAGSPTAEGERVDRIRFEIGEDMLRIVLADYEQTDREKHIWEYVERDAREIPLPGPVSRGNGRP